MLKFAVYLSVYVCGMMQHQQADNGITCIEHMSRTNQIQPHAGIGLASLSEKIDGCLCCQYTMPAQLSIHIKLLIDGL